MSKRVPEALSKLREATRAEHAALEALIGAERHLSHAERPQQAFYANFLAVHYVHHQMIADTVRASHDCLSSPILDWPDCRRIRAIEEDLIQFESLPEPQTRKAKSVSEAFLLGLCYVSEGACMGNQMMYNRLRQNQYFMEWQADAFFRSCRQGFATRWHTFVDRIACMSSKVEEEDLLKGGNRGFLAFSTYWQERIRQAK